MLLADRPPLLLQMGNADLDTPRAAATSPGRPTGRHRAGRPGGALRPGPAATSDGGTWYRSPPFESEPFMHLFDVATLLIVLMLVGVEFSVAAFVDPAAWRLEPEPQLELLSRLAAVLGKVMPVWYPACALLFLIQTWLRWRTPGLAILLVADGLWLLASVASILFLVPLNTRIAQGAADWQQAHRLWDKRHRVRVAALAAAAVLLADVVVG